MTEHGHGPEKDRLKELCQAHGLGERAEEAQALLTSLFAGEEKPAIEFFLADKTGARELRAVVINENAQAALALSKKLAGESSENREALESLLSLFAPQAGAAPKLRHVLSIAKDRPPALSTCFDTQPQGRYRAPALVEEALCRLGYPRSWPVLSQSGPRGLELDEITGLLFAPGKACPPHLEVTWRHHEVPPQNAATITVLGDPQLLQPGFQAPLLSLSQGLDQKSAAADKAPLQEATEVVRRYETDILLANHPYLARLGREPVNLSFLWLILEGFWESIVKDFPARLARAIAHMDDDRFRSIFVKQLNDELGEGDFSRAHKAMFRTFVEAVAPYRMSGELDRLLAPARKFGRKLTAHLESPDYFETVGALMMIEIYGKQIDIRMGEEFRRQNVLDLSALKWLHLHETLEVDHADDSQRLAEILPRKGEGPEAENAVAAVWRGAQGVVKAGHEYFDDLYRVCFA